MRSQLAFFPRIMRKVGLVARGPRPRQCRCDEGRVGASPSTGEDVAWSRFLCKLHRKRDTDGGVKPPGLGLLDWHDWSEDPTARPAVSEAKLAQTRRRRPGTHHGGRRAVKASMEPTVCPVVSDVRGSHEWWSETSRIRWADPDAASAVAWRVERRRIWRWCPTRADNENGAGRLDGECLEPLMRIRRMPSAPSEPIAL